LSSDEADTFTVLISSLSVDDRDPGTVDLLADPPVMDLVDYFAALPDSRDLRWVTHPLAVVLTPVRMRGGGRDDVVHRDRRMGRRYAASVAAQALWPMW
jgi:hypothetical protein